jgi:hypothetical protein
MRHIHITIFKSKNKNSGPDQGKTFPPDAWDIDDEDLLKNRQPRSQARREWSREDRRYEHRFELDQ